MPDDQRPKTKDHELFDLIAEHVRSNPKDYYEAGGWLDDYCSEEAYWRRVEAELEELKKDKMGVLPVMQQVRSLQEQLEERRTPALMVRFQEARRDLLDNNEKQTLISLNNAKRILVVTWLSTDPDAEKAGVELTSLQQWHWEPTNDLTSMSRGAANALWVESGSAYEDWVELTHKAWNRVKRASAGRKALGTEARSGAQYSGSDVFIVHGYDESVKNEVASFIRELGLKAIILHEEANKGRTIIEKFEDHANVGFAVVLMTPDDVGARSDHELDLKPRARQNVVMELGFFLGKLGRERVCALHKGNLEIPSDYQGVLFVPLDGSVDWRESLRKEIEAAGIEIGDTEALVVPTALHGPPAEEGPRLSKDAELLLKDASRDRQGDILRILTADGLSVQTNGKDFVEDGLSPREQAKWESAIEQLEQFGLIADRGQKREVFGITQDGYDMADRLTP